jgi:medium-chain acyl-[acyl-carrier-protein] hydrolase
MPRLKVAAPSTGQWFMQTSRKPQAEVRLFCFPYAGGGTPIFRNWPQHLPSNVDLYAAQLPGRGARLNDAPFTDLMLLVDSLGKAIRPYLDRPFAFFGHSMGGMISFELSRLLRAEYGIEPAHLFISGRRAPHIPDTDSPTYDLPEDLFIEEVRRLNGTPREVLEHPELMELMVPILRADFSICQTYQFRGDRPLDCPMTVLGGLEDTEVSREQLEAWREHTTGSFSMRLFPGDHFFVQSQQPLVLRVLSQELFKLVKTSHG